MTPDEQRELVQLPPRAGLVSGAFSPDPEVITLRNAREKLATAVAAGKFAPSEALSVLHMIVDQNPALLTVVNL